VDLVDTLKGHLAFQEAEAMAASRPRPRWLFTAPEGDIIRSNNFRDRLRDSSHHERANLVYVQKQLGHSSIKITVDLYTHWIEAVDRGHTREVDRLMLVPGGGTSGGTQGASEPEVLAKTGEDLG
jgi:integrase